MAKKVKKRTCDGYQAFSNDFPVVKPQKIEISIDTSISTPIYEQISSYIREQIISGRLESGQRIPSARQISLEIGVSYVTVARGLNSLVNEGLLESNVPGGTYVAHRRGNRLQTLGIMGYEPYAQMAGHSQYYRKLTMLLLEKVVQYGRTVVYNYWPPDMVLRKMFNNMSLIDGLILLCSEGETRFDQLMEIQRIGLPIICVGKTFDDNIPTVDSNNRADTMRAVKHLVKMGHKRIALLGSSNIYQTNAGMLRLQGYQKAMEEVGLGFNLDLVILGEAKEQAEKLTAMSNPATAAIIAYSHAEVAKLLDNLKGTSIKPGKNFFLCAYDEDLWNSIGPAGIDYMRIEQPLADIATNAIEELIKMLNEHGYHPEPKLLPSKIVSITADGQHTILK